MKSPRDLRRLAVTQTPVKNSQGVNNNNNNNNKVFQNNLCCAIEVKFSVLFIIYI